MPDDYSPTLTQDATERMVLAPGIYPFCVQDFERRQANSGNKMVTVTLEVSGADEATALVFDNLVITAKSQWKLAQFFTSIGLKQKGVDFTVDWTLTPGRTGYVELSEDREYNNNKVVSYLAPDSKKIPQAIGATSPSTPPTPFTPGEL